MTNGFKKKVTYFLFILSLVAFPTAFAVSDLEGIQIYQKNFHLSSEHKQKLAEDINRYRHADDLWDALRDGFAMNHYEEDPLVQEQIQWFMSHQDFLVHSATRAAPYLYYILQQSKLRHLPAEVVLLPMIESAYNPYAYSSAGASGIWQMMPRTASGYGIKQDWWYDGRRDVIASTKAALSHLSYLKTFFDGNWVLAIAAYDTGEGNVQNAVRKNVRDGKSTDFLSLPLAQETRIYVPRLLALATIIANPDKYPVYFPPIRNAPYLAQIDLGSQIDLKHAANLAGLSLKELLALNPGYNHSASSPNGPYKLVLPIQNLEQFSENFASLPVTNRITWQRYQVHVGDTVARVALRYNVSADSLRKMNQLTSNNLKVGSSLLVPHTVPAISKSILEAEQKNYFREPKIATNNIPIKKKSFASKLKEVPMFADREVRKVESTLENSLKNIHGQYVIQPGDTIYMARSGDTFDSIAKHFHTNVKDLKIVNPYKASKALHAGDKLVIPTHIVKTQVAKAAHKSLEPGDTIYMVRRGDTMDKIAKKFHTSAPAIRVANLIADNDLQEGENIVIPTHM
jgi:membrane-bound lytic murein transglycosylase D